MQLRNDFLEILGNEDFLVEEFERENACGKSEDCEALFDRVGAVITRLGLGRK
jgi:hypothetical protein